MIRRPDKKGSALLIVLGMSAFMLVSAIAFSAYMRAARLPSSYLRRTASSRLLVKAGLARAIDAVDRAINNNPHPGVGSMVAAGGAKNVWKHRVFMGSDSELSPEGTVSPLCLEALAYIPPPLVNEARYYSRRSPTCQWASLGFDSGRYAYCALDVSDYFDVNRLTANSARSSAPARRTSFAYLFESDTHKSSGSGAGAWDSFMEQFRGPADENTLRYDFKANSPLISLADFNLALGRHGKIGQFSSPFYDYLQNSGGTGFYNTSSDADEDRLRRMTFVTDGLFCEDEEETDDAGNPIERFDLNDGDNQPFAPEFLAATKPALSDVVLGKRLLSDGHMKWLEKLSGLGCAALYDYLDPDHVPISLSVPTTERVPMICGMRPLVPNSKFGVRKELTPGNADTVIENIDATTRMVERKVRYVVDSSKFIAGFLPGEIKTLVVFPFAHADEKDSSSFKVDGRMSMFFTSEEMSLRTGEVSDLLHLDSSNIGNGGLDSAKGLINIKLSDEPISIASKISQEQDAVKEISLSLRDGQTLGPALSMEGNEILSITYRWRQTMNTNTGGVSGLGTWTPEFNHVWNNPQTAEEIIAHCGIPALKADGTVDPDFTDAKMADFVKAGITSGKRMILNAAVWLRVKDADGKIVDMVPACLNDDKIQNSVNDPDPRIQLVGKDEFAGVPFPVMRFDTGIDFTLSVQELNNLSVPNQEKDIIIAPEGAIVADPRYNFAPEHWFKLAGELTAEAYLGACQVGSGDRDGDIFMATSDAGYMQSPHEVAFLPRFTDLRSYGDRISSGNMIAPDRGYGGKTIPGSFAQTANNALAWRTYDTIDIDYDAFCDLPWTSDGAGYKVNPYSDSTNVLMAVFANTPIDWKRASTNVADGVSECAGDFMDDAQSFNKQYAFNEYSSSAKFAWKDLEGIAGRFSDVVRQKTDWESAWRDLGWYDGLEKLCGVTLDSETDNLWFADRKFLYGYWREAFAARQQLFIIFVRAEPMMMGGGAVGLIPPQLGARAVAVVWRDPCPSREPGDPHQTRILFYRQFE